MQAPGCVHVRLLRPEDRVQWLAMRGRLWPDADEDDARRWLEQDAGTFVAEAAGCPGSLLGFAEVGLRGYADGCDSSPVAFLEGLYVEQNARRRGVGSLLVGAVVDWARTRGLTEVASDALLDNLPGQAVHGANGFVEVERSVKYRMVLGKG